jgi:hypothetical protein
VAHQDQRTTALFRNVHAYPVRFDEAVLDVSHARLPSLPFPCARKWSYVSVDCGGACRKEKWLKSGYYQGLFAVAGAVKEAVTPVGSQAFRHHPLPQRLTPTRGP